MGSVVIGWGGEEAPGPGVSLSHDHDSQGKAHAELVKTRHLRSVPGFGCIEKRVGVD